MLAMALVVSLLVSTGDTPEVRVTPVGYKTVEACQEWQAAMAGAKQSVIDPISGKILQEVTYQCVPVSGEMELADLQAALAKD